MSEEVKQMAIQLKEILNKYPNKQIEILSYVFGKDNLRKIINQPTYDELQQENKQLKAENEDLKEKIILLKASEPMLELEKYYGERDKYKEVIEEVREVIRDSHVEVLKYHDEPSETTSYEIVTVELLQILDKAKGEH